MARWFGYNTPFIGGNQNIFSRQEDVKLIKNDILQRLLTVPTERVMRPTFGTGLRAFVFGQMDDNDISSLKSEINNSILEDGRITVEYLELTPNKDNQLLNIKIILKEIENPTSTFTIEAEIGI